MEYQFHRLVLFSRLLESYPYSQSRIVAEALLDVCPLLRGEVWAALLGVKVTNQPGHMTYTAANVDNFSLKYMVMFGIASLAR